MGRGSGSVRSLLCLVAFWGGGWAVGLVDAGGRRECNSKVVDYPPAKSLFFVPSVKPESTWKFD